MKKTILFIVSILLATSMLSACCYYPYHYGYGDGRYGRGYYYDRGNDDYRGGSRDYRERY